MDVESQVLLERPRGEVLRWVPVIGLVVSFYSAVFATFILYPWHVELSNEFAGLQQICASNPR
jgi:hypothetical protein